MPIIEHYRKQDLVAEVNANQTLEEVCVHKILLTVFNLGKLN